MNEKELLQALKEAEKWITELIEAGEHSGPDDPKDWPIVAKIRSAIANATT